MKQYRTLCTFTEHCRRRKQKSPPQNFRLMMAKWANLLDDALDGKEDASNSKAGVDEGDEVVESKGNLPAKLVEGPAQITRHLSVIKTASHWGQTG